MENVEIREEEIEVIPNLTGDDIDKDGEDVIDRDKCNSLSEFKLIDIRNVGLRTGESYSDNIGHYIVNSITDGKVFIRYHSTGKEEIRDEAILIEKTIERLLSNIAQGQGQQKHPKKENEKDGRKGNSYYRRPFLFTPSNSFYKTLGYLAKNSNLYVRVLLKNVDDFYERFFELKGYDPVVEPGVFCILKSNKESSAWSNELSVFVELPSWELGIGNIKPENEKKDTGRATFNSTSLVWWLLEKGFNLGREHDIKAIRVSVPEWYRESFDLGMSDKGENV